jgi:hypothetical protein
MNTTFNLEVVLYIEVRKGVWKDLGVYLLRAAVISLG